MDLLVYEKAFADDGYQVVCGVDEAGRGPLAGPVFAAAVVLPEQFVLDKLGDSKKLSEKTRERLYDEILEQAADYQIAAASEQEIDELNILNATFLAMRRAVEGLAPRPEVALIDGNRAPALEGTVPYTIVKGDSLSASIAAASILAKVSRDRYMLRLDEAYPQYAFAKHKGYPTKLHYERLAEYGPCPVHRRTFLKKFFAAQGR